MCLLLLARTDGRGSDVRLSSSELQKPSRVHRTPMDPGLWVWRRSFGWDFTLSEHINVLELQAIVLELRRRCRLTSEHDKRYILITDSAVCIGVVSKRRSSSRKLNMVVRKLAALCLGSGCEPVMIHVRSAANLAYRPSRTRVHKHHGKE